MSRRRIKAPRALAAALMSRAWDDDVGDRDRRMLEAASICLEQLLDRVVLTSHLLEASEARRMDWQLMRGDDLDTGEAL